MGNGRYREKCLSAKGHSCKVCGRDDRIDVHHIDGDRENNSLGNLIPLCPTCHTRIHTEKELDGALAGLQSQLPDSSVNHKPGESKLRKEVGITKETKELLDRRKPEGITQNFYIRHAIWHAPSINESIPAPWEGDE